MTQAKKLKWLLLMMLSSAISQASDNKVLVSDFSNHGLEGWREKSFSGNTSYELSVDGGNTVLVAKASSSASGLGKRIKVDLNKTPFINWSWKIDNKLAGLEETTKQGDDYVARLYVVKTAGALRWKTKALNYVWSSNQDKGVSWPNAYRPKNAVMLSVRGQDDLTGQWFNEKRNVQNDLRSAFGTDFDAIDAVAIMTDTDNSKRQASAVYGEIFFTAN